jgi:signal transduction histidine kinase/DNA-binding response OmpR family regulator
VVMMLSDLFLFPGFKVKSAISTLALFFRTQGSGHIFQTTFLGDVSFEALAVSVVALLFITILSVATAIFFIRSQRKLKRSLAHAEERALKQEEVAREERKARLEADQSNMAKSDFLATMSHEIRTPMYGVVGMAGLLRQTSLTSEQKEYTDSIQSCSESLLTVINDILDFSKMEAGKMEVERKDFNLRTCIEEVLDVFANKADKSGIDLSYQIDLKVPNSIIGDSLRLRQVMINLVGNAMKFSQGEVFIGVHLQRAGENDAQLGFVVRDNGIGIPPDKLNRLFKSFSQVDSSTTRKYGGTGLGLVICEKLVKLMGGDISVQSEVGKGSEFSFSVTVGLSQEARQEATLNTESLVGKKILMVGGSGASFSVIQHNLQHLEMATASAASGKQGLFSLIEDADFDLVIAEMQMSDMDGLQFASRVRQEYANLPIILLSGLGDDKPKGRLETKCCIVNKPVKPNALVRQMVRLLNEEENEPAVQAPEPAAALSSDFAKLYPLQILIADDNTVNQKLAERVLNKLGYKPDKASNGEEACLAHEKVNYDLIFMDAQMPVLDGYEATKRIRLQKQRQPVIIATTASAMTEDLNSCIEGGMNDYLSKPFKFEDMIKILEKWAPQVKSVNMCAA